MNPINRALNAITYYSQESISRACLFFLRPINLWFFKNYDGRNVENSDVVLILIAKHDMNGALSVPKPLTTFRLHNHKTTKIVYKEVSQIEDITSAINDLKTRSNRIKGLWINAHGTSCGFRLDQHETVSNCNYPMAQLFPGEARLGKGNAFQLRDALHKLEKDAVIALTSCSTAYIGSEGHRSIAQTFATLAPGRLVYAPTKDVRVVGMHFTWERDALKPCFMTEHVSGRTGLLGKISNFFYTSLFLFSCGTYGTSMTAVHRSYKELDV